MHLALCTYRNRKSEDLPLATNKDTPFNAYNQVGDAPNLVVSWQRNDSGRARTGKTDEILGSIYKEQSCINDEDLEGLSQKCANNTPRAMICVDDDVGEKSCVIIPLRMPGTVTVLNNSHVTVQPVRCVRNDYPIYELCSCHSIRVQYISL